MCVWSESRQEKVNRVLEGWTPLSHPWTLEGRDAMLERESYGENPFHSTLPVSEVYFHKQYYD